MQVRLRAPSAIMAAVLVLAFVLAACASGSGDQASADAAASQSTQSSQGSGASPDAAPPDAPPGGGVDGSDIDWATVDLTTIDWAAIDMSTVDFPAPEHNPTADSLSEEQRALILSRLDLGSATFVLGEDTYETDSFVCNVGEENNGRLIATHLEAIGQFDLDGMEVAVIMYISDPAAVWPPGGEGTVYELTFRDITEDPQLHWADNGSETPVVLDGRHISAAGVFDNQLTPDVEEAVPGTIEGDCGTPSTFPDG